MTKERTCWCGAEIPQAPGVGRPRVTCDEHKGKQRPADYVNRCLNCGGVAPRKNGRGAWPDYCEECRDPSGRGLTALERSPYLASAAGSSQVASTHTPVPTRVRAKGQTLFCLECGDTITQNENAGRVKRTCSSCSGRNPALSARGRLTTEQYNAMVEAQGGLCAICFKPEVRRKEDGTLRALAVDHDHVTGRIRKLLCHRCNLGLGHFDDDIMRLVSAVTYLGEHRST
jgi:hypothetical protein